MLLPRGVSKGGKARGASPRFSPLWRGVEGPTLQGLTLVVLCWFLYIVARGKFGSWAFVGLDRRIPPDLGATRPQTPQARALRGPLQPAPKGGPVGAMRPKRAPLWKPPIFAAHGEGDPGVLRAKTT